MSPSLRPRDVGVQVTDMQTGADSGLWKVPSSVSLGLVDVSVNNGTLSRVTGINADSGQPVAVVLPPRSGTQAVVAPLFDFGPLPSPREGASRRPRFRKSSECRRSWWDLRGVDDASELHLLSVHGTAALCDAQRFQSSLV